MCLCMCVACNSSLSFSASSPALWPSSSASTPSHHDAWLCKLKSSCWVYSVRGSKSISQWAHFLSYLVPSCDRFTQEVLVISWPFNPSHLVNLFKVSVTLTTQRHCECKVSWSMAFICLQYENYLSHWVKKNLVILFSCYSSANFLTDETFSYKSPSDIVRHSQLTCYPYFTECLLLFAIVCIDWLSDSQCVCASCLLLLSEKIFFLSLSLSSFHPLHRNLFTCLTVR